MPIDFNINIVRECPKCHADRTMLDTTFGLPGYIDPDAGSQNVEKDSGECINVTAALPVRVVLCPRCHYLEMYHNVG